MLTLDPPAEWAALERQAARLAALGAALSALRVARPVLSSAEWKGAAATSHETRAARLDRDRSWLRPRRS